MKRRDDIQNELNDIAPRLSERVPTNPFAVPENYFDALPENTLQHVKRMNGLVESLHSESTVSTNPFETPRGYFDNSPNVILHRAKSEPKVVELKPSRRWKTYFSVAAAFAALLLTSVPMLQNQQNVNGNSTKAVANVTLEQVTDDELYTYLSNDVTGVRMDEIAAHVPDATLDTLEKEMLSLHVNTIRDDALLDVANMDLDLIELL